MAKAPRTLVRSILWVTDPWLTLVHASDTTLRLAEECLRYEAQGYLDQGVWWADHSKLRLENGRVYFEAHRIRKADWNPSVPPGEPAVDKEPWEFTQIHWRTDPPVDLHYTQPLQLLRLGLRLAPATHVGLTLPWRHPDYSALRYTEVVNPPDILLSGSEKFEAAAQGLLANSIVSSQVDRLKEWGRAHKKVVMKPLHNAQSKGIELLDFSSEVHAKKSIERIQLAQSSCTLPGGEDDAHTVPVMLQEYLPEIDEGETRLWYLDGDLLGALQKKPLQNDFRVDIDRGSTVQKARLTEAEKEIAAQLSQGLRDSHIRLAAIDVIGNKITDFNFTSPGLLRQLEKVTGVPAASQIIERLLEISPTPEGLQ